MQNAEGMCPVQHISYRQYVIQYLFWAPFESITVLMEQGMEAISMQSFAGELNQMLWYLSVAVLDQIYQGGQGGAGVCSWRL